jgi:subtilisin family serine protease
MDDGRRTTRRMLAGVAALMVVAMLPVAAPAAPADRERKLRGGLARLVAEGLQPDMRLDYLAPGYRRGEFVVYVVVDKRASERVHDVRAAGARVRWAFRSVRAISVVASREVVLRLASKPWVRALYPVLSGRVDDTNTSISGSITRGSPPREHELEVPANSYSVTVDLAVAPPAQPHTDENVADFLEARLANPSGKAVMVRSQLAHQLSFRYSQPSPLEAGSWALQIWYRSGNQPTVPLTFVYQGSAVVGTSPVEVSDPSEIPARGCSSAANTAGWKSNPNLRKRSVTDIGAPVLWNAGIRGRGVRLAVLDTGVDASHADLDDQDFEHWGEACEPKVIADALFTGAQMLPGQGRFDVGSHGTHVAGEAAGSAEGSGEDEWGTYPGVAPEASIIAGRIAIDVTALTDDMLAAAEWAVIDQQADVLNMSFGIDVRYGVLTDENDPQSAGFEALVTNPAWGNPSIQISAGNSGDLFQSVGIPAATPHVNAIAATVKDWDLTLKGSETRETGDGSALGTKDAKGLVHPSITNFSSRGPTADLFLGPDFAAPGRSIVAALTNQNTDGTQNGYASFSGTSMASPHATGSAALLVDGYRRSFGTAGRFGNRPPFWLVAAAISNTAGAPAPRPAFLGGTLSKVSYATGLGGLLQLYGEAGSREDGLKTLAAVGPLVEGAGRVNLPAALSALTQGVRLYTAGSPASAAWYELQPSFQAGTAKRLDSVTRTLRIDPATGHPYAVSFRAASGAPSLNARTIPASWWTLPPATSVAGGKAGSVSASLTIPAGSTPGYYTGYILADVVDQATGQRWALRMPAFVAVEITDDDAGEGPVEVTGFTKAEDSALLYTGVTGVSSDFPLYGIEAPEGLERLELRLEGDNANDTWDLFVYDRYGMVVADTFLALPSQSASLSLANLEPGEYRIGVSLTDPGGGNTDADGAPGRAYRLSADLIGAASPKASAVLGGRRTPPPAPRPGPLPATGVGSSWYVLGVLALGAALGLGRAIAQGARR